MSLLPATGIERILWAILILLVIGYLVGIWLNRQRSKAIGAWLQAGLGKLGGRVAWRWIRSMNSGAEVTVAEARPPFRQLQISYFLLTREFAPLWGLELLQGKRDLLALRCELRVSPTQELHVLPWRGRLRNQLDQTAGDILWHWAPMPAGLGLATRFVADEALVGRMAAFLERYGAHVERLSLSRRSPQLILFFSLTGIEKRPIAELWAALGDLLKTG
ncbi:MAG: hypothetical protein ACUVR4_12575 [Anaerolineae bacterium]